MAGIEGRRRTARGVPSVEHYVSPSWYATKAETHKVVPTWNYIVVQVRGPAMVDDSREWLHGQIDQLTQQHEASRAGRGP